MPALFLTYFIHWTRRGLVCSMQLGAFGSIISAKQSVILTLQIFVKIVSIFIISVYLYVCTEKSTKKYIGTR